MKPYLTKWRQLSAALAFAFAASPLSATVLLTEHFNYSAGNLYQQGGWVKFGGQTGNPIQVVDGSLTFDGYKPTEEGGRVQILNPVNSAEQDLHRPFDNDQVVLDGAVYLGALVNIQSVAHNTDDTYNSQFILTFDGRTKASAIADAKSTNNYWRLFVRESKTEGKFTFGLGKNKTEPTVYTEKEYDLGTTYFVVLKYEYVAGSTNDILSLYIDETDTTEPSAPAISTDAGTDANSSAINNNSGDYGIGGVVIMQNGSATKPAPEFELDALRATTSWVELFAESGNSNPDTPQPAYITAGKLSQFANTVPGYAMTQTINVKGANLKGDVTVTSPDNAAFSVSANTIAQADVESSKGFDLVVTFNPSAAGSYSGSFTISAEGVDPIAYTLSGQAAECTDIAYASQLVGLTAASDSYYRYTGTATITFIDTQNKVIYAMEEMRSGLAINYKYVGSAGTLAIGDKITNVVGFIEKIDGVPFIDNVLQPVVESSGNGKVPRPATLTDILESPELYINCLVEVEDLTFDVADGATFAAEAVTVKEGDKTGYVLPFAGTSLIGTAIPTEGSVVGIVRSMTTANISPRSADDVVAKVYEPSLTITRTYFYTGEPLPIGQTTVVARYEVVAENLTKAGEVWISGTNRTQFAVSSDVIAKGTSTAVYEVLYTPTTIGKHTGRITFDVTPAELTQGEAFTFYAYDPANPPTISLQSGEPDVFRTTPGTPVKQTLVVTTANLVDFGSATIHGQSGGLFIINNTTLLKNGSTQITITFDPVEAGKYTEVLELSALKTESILLTLQGESTGSRQLEEQEGDQLALSEDNPTTYLYEHFYGVTKNSPLSLYGWQNVALNGTRAWWGYEFEDDGNTAAKVTAYDSKVAEGAGEECQMMLITPALDFLKAESKLLTFRIMGQNLRDEQTDKLEVCYIDIADGGNLYVQPLTGVDVPTSSDYNDEWQDYVVDFEGQELADVFFIGFRFTSTRGRENSAVYYIDDVSFGRTDVPQIKLADDSFEGSLETGMQTSLCVLVEGKNLQENIAVSLSGEQSAYYTLLTESLPATGGLAEATFTADEEGEYYGLLTLKSSGAPTVYFPMTVTVAVPTSIVKVIAPDEAGLYTVYTVAGVRVLQTRDARAIAKLPAGIYLVNGRKYVVK